MSSLPNASNLKTLLWLFFHALIYIFFLGILGRFVFVALLRFSGLSIIEGFLFDGHFFELADKTAISHSIGTVDRIISGVIFGAFFGIAGSTIGGAKQNDYVVEWSEATIFVPIIMGTIFGVLGGGIGGAFFGAFLIILMFSFVIVMNFIVRSAIACLALVALAIMATVVTIGSFAWVDISGIVFLFIFGGPIFINLTVANDDDFVDSPIRAIFLGTHLGIAGGAIGGSVLGITLGVTSTIFWMRPYYHLMFWWLIWPKPLGHLYQLHPVAWDDRCLVPFPGFSRLLVAYAEYTPQEGVEEIGRLINNYPSQRAAALHAKTILLARRSAEIAELDQLNTIVGQLPGGRKAFLFETKQVREMIGKIIALQARLDKMNRAILREPLSQILYGTIEGFKQQIVRFHEPLASEFGRAADKWLALAKGQLQSAQQMRSQLVNQFSEIKSLRALDGLIRELPEDDDENEFAEYTKLRSMLAEIAGIQFRLETMNRAILREPNAQIVFGKLENLRYKVASFDESIVRDFGRAVEHWLELARVQLRDTQTILTKEPNPQVFRAGDPVDREQEAFVPRYVVVGDLEKQIMLATGCPGLVLYGRRRMGKSTILGNLSGFLPDTVVCVFISMQDPQAFTSLEAWTSHLAQKLSAAVALPSAITNTTNDLTGFMRVLAAFNAHLQENGKRVLLAIDEYENLDRKLGERVFPEDLLATIRESIQTHRNITWIFSGSHEITELKHAEWPSYLVSARTIEVPMFTMAETRLLLTEPLKFSPLFKDESKRPRFEPGFWGENGIERIQHEAGGWPHLVQLIAETIVDLINDETKSQVDAELFERSLNKAIVSGHNVLYQLMRGESTLPGEWEYLSAFRKRELQPPPGDEKIYASLRRRLLVVEEIGEWRLRVPLMARWLRERG